MPPTYGQPAYAVELENARLMTAWSAAKPERPGAPRDRGPLILSQSADLLHQPGDALMKGDEPPGPGSGHIVPTDSMDRDEAGTPPGLDLPFDAGSLAALQRATQAHVSQAGMPPDRATDMVIGLHELAANAVRHGAGSGRLRISVRATRGAAPH